MRTPTIVALVLLTWLAQARAEGSPDDADADADAAADADDAAAAAAPPTITTKAKAKDKVKDKVKANGRVFVRETLSDDLGSWDAQAKIDSARLGLRYHHEQLKARVEVELRSSAKLRAAFVELDLGHDLELRTGLFKLPLSPLEFGSGWELPVADRGLLSGILRDRLQLAGRRVGAQLSYSPGHAACPWWKRPRVLAGYWQGLNDQEDPLDVSADDGYGKVGAARLELGPLGATAQLRAGTPATLALVRHAWAGAVDATVDWHGLRLWAEATVGSSWLVADPNRDSAIFVEARTVLAYRLGGAHEGARYLEPYTQLGLLEPDTRIADDLVIEATGGINAGRWQRWRVQLELELWRIDANAPVGITQALTRATDHTAVLLQVAAAFGK